MQFYYLHHVLGMGQKDKHLYNLIQYRTSEAKRLKVAPYRIFTNQSLEEIVKFKPINDNLLKNIHGIGDAKIRDYGKDIIKIVKETF